MTGIQVTSRTLDRRDAEHLLAMHHTGRMAFAFHDRVMMTLVNYVYANGWIYARLEQGPTLGTLQHHQWVAFEVDEIRGVYDWRTVIIHGSVQFLENDRSLPEWRDFNRALELLRGQVPSILTTDDPHPERVKIYRIHLDECFARESTSNSVQTLPRA
jgi:nitroimidazol reductase NimA-like FMN-containing flavoprotein (pyridoxamine 5'-phosphate oxidase superfamily)